ncbi:hypothetical protein QJ48_14585 [Paenibacillus sp. A3]|nr:hypothetical protein QJ48_14585 [Paenibacillus sp. A3]
MMVKMMPPRTMPMMVVRMESKRMEAVGMEAMRMKTMRMETVGVEAMWMEAVGMPVMRMMRTDVVELLCGFGFDYRLLRHVDFSSLIRTYSTICQRGGIGHLSILKMGLIILFFS